MLLVAGRACAMSQSKLGWVAGILVSLAAPQIAGAGTIDFSDLPDGSYYTISGDRYRSQGVLLSTNGVELQVNRHLPAANFVYGTSNGADGNADRLLIVDFVLPGTSTPGYTASVDFFVVNDSSPTSTFRVSVFGPGDVLLADVPGLKYTHFSLSRPEGDIHRVVLTPVDSLDALGAPFVFGEITEAPLAAVPEPGTLALVSVGVLALGARRRSGHA